MIDNQKSMIKSMLLPDFFATVPKCDGTIEGEANHFLLTWYMPKLKLS